MSVIDVYYYCMLLVSVLSVCGRRGRDVVTPRRRDVSSAINVCSRLWSGCLFSLEVLVSGVAVCRQRGRDVTPGRRDAVTPPLLLMDVILLALDVES